MRLPCNGSERDLFFAEDNEHLVELFNLLIAVRQVEVDAAVLLQLTTGCIRNRQMMPGKFFFLLLDDLAGDLIRFEHQADIFNTHLTDECKGFLAFHRADRDLGTHRHKKYLR